MPLYPNSLIPVSFYNSDFKELSLLVQNALYIKKIIKQQNYKDILDIFADIESKNQ